MKIQKATLEYWALMAEIIGAVAVVVSVIYLALQIGENTKVLRSQAHFNALSLAQRPFEMVIDNEGLSKILNVGFATPDKLTSEEWLRCSYYMVHAVQCLGISLLPASRRLDSEGTVGRRRRVVQAIR
jgi:hypothetical protein